MSLYCLHCASWLCPKTNGGHSGLLPEEPSNNHRYEDSFEEYIKIHPDITGGTYGGTVHKAYWSGMKRYINEGNVKDEDTLTHDLIVHHHISNMARSIS